MSAVDVIHQFGLALVLVGLLIETVAFVAMEFYPIRRRLPFKSPLILQSWGCIGFTLGVVLLLVAGFVGK